MPILVAVLTPNVCAVAIQGVIRAALRTLVIVDLNVIVKRDAAVTVQGRIDRDE